MDTRVKPESGEVRGGGEKPLPSSVNPAGSLHRRLKVAFIGPYPPPYSGPELGMKQFLDSGLSRELNIRFIKTNFRNSNADKARIGLTSLVWTALFHVRLIWSLIVFRPKVAYYPITPTAAGWVGRDAPCLLFCKLLGVRSVIHLRGGHLRLNFQTFSPMARRLTRWACRTVSLALVQAECLRDQFAGLVSAERVRVLPQALDVAEYSAASTSEGDAKTVLFLGNLSYAKGYCDLLRALPIVSQAVPDVTFVFCGSMIEGPTGVYYDQITGRKLQHESPRQAHQLMLESAYSGNYQWKGVVSGSEKLALLRSCALVTLPSYSEGFSRTLMEAMAVGKPVVCTPVGAHREYIADRVNGLVVPPGEVAALAKAIVTLLADRPLRQAIGQNNRRYVREKFEIGIVAKTLGEFLSEAAHAKR